MDNAYKSQDIIAAPIRVIQLIYNSGVSPWQVGDVGEKSLLWYTFFPS